MYAYEWGRAREKDEECNRLDLSDESVTRKVISLNVLGNIFPEVHQGYRRIERAKRKLWCCVCVCVCVWGRERERERERDRERETACSITSEHCIGSDALCLPKSTAWRWSQCITLTVFVCVWMCTHVHSYTKHMHMFNLHVQELDFCCFYVWGPYGSCFCHGM